MRAFPMPILRAVASVSMIRVFPKTCENAFLYCGSKSMRSIARPWTPRSLVSFLTSSLIVAGLILLSGRNVAVPNRSFLR